MMRLSPKAIDELKRVYADECKVELTDAEAQALGVELLELFDLLIESSPEEAQQQSTR